ncbi:MAG: ABC transporter ATP-binding protein [Pararhodobacter sp.]|nr:ABC transporter ATP-binding protein [Pararhodobacter sp.]
MGNTSLPGASDAAPTPRGAPALSIRDLEIRLPAGMDGTHAVNRVSFDLVAGQILCIIGESGSGKSMLANAVLGLLPPPLVVNGGEILYGGRDLVTLGDEEMRDLRGRAIAMIFQDPLSALNPLMTVGRQIAGVMEAHAVGTPAERRARALALLREVELPDPEVLIDQDPFRLSGGQRQRVMIAMALALEPDVLIADEPTTALDVTTQAQILRLIHDIQRRKGMSVLFITHDFGVVSEIADQVVVMEKGHLVESGAVADVLRRPSHPYTRRLVASIPRMAEAGRQAAEQPPEVVLEVRHLDKTYRSGGFLSRRRETHAVNDLSFTLRRGQTLGVVGESGSGKSTLGRMLMKLDTADSGQILLGGTDVTAMPEKVFRPLRPRIQMVFQDPFASLNPRHQIRTVLTAGPMAHGRTRQVAEADAVDLLQRVGLEAQALDRYPHEFSGGQRQRIGIARALMFRPDVIVADEAVSALDVSIQAQVLRLLLGIQAETGVAMVFITHDLRVASSICDEVMVMHLGRVVEIGAPHEVFRTPRADYTRRLVDAIPVLDVDPSPAEII